MAVDTNSSITLFTPISYVEVAAPPHLEKETGKSCLGLLEGLAFASLRILLCKGVLRGICHVLEPMKF